MKTDQLPGRPRPIRASLAAHVKLASVTARARAKPAGGQPDRALAGPPGPASRLAGARRALAGPQLPARAAAAWPQDRTFIRCGGRGLAGGQSLSC